MKILQLLTLLIFSNSVLAQTDSINVNLRIVDCKIKNTELTLDTINGVAIEMNTIFVTAKTKVQMSCNYRDPSRNKYSTVKNKLSVSYAYDPNGTIYDSIIGEINDYLNEQEEWAKKYKSGNDFSYLPFYKSFYLSGSIKIPYIWTGAENPGDYQIFYINDCVYKIELQERNGLGCLSLFTSQNMHFVNEQGKIEFDKYVKNIDEARKFIKEHNKG